MGSDLIPSASYKSLLRRITRQSGTVFIGKVVFYCLGLPVGILLARILGPSSLGKFQLGLVTIQFTSIFCVAGFDTGLKRFLPLFEIAEPGRIRAFLVQNFGITLSLSVVFSIALFIFSPALATYYFHSDEMTVVLRLFCLYLPVFALSRVGFGALVGSKRADVASVIGSMISPSFFLMLLVVISLFGGGLYSSIMMRTTAHLLALGCCLVFLLPKYPIRAHPSNTVYPLSNYLSFSIPLMFMGLIYFLLGQMDVIMLGHFVDEKDVGIYTVAVKLAMFVLVGLEIVLPILSPHFSELSEQKDFATIEALFKSATKWVFYPALMVFSLVLVLRLEVLSIYGAEFEVGAMVVLILALGQLVNVLSGPTGLLLVMTGNQRWEMMNTILIVFLNFILNLFLIPRMGTVGAAIATALSISAINIAKLVEVYVLYGFHPYSSKHLKGIVAVLGGYVACYCVRMVVISSGGGALWIIGLGTIALIATSLVGVWMLGLDSDDRMLVEMVRPRGLRR